eukprot:10340121-Ditylum_brightwellii.AAC.1
MLSMITKNIAIEKKIHRELFNELKDHCSCTKSAKTRINKYRAYLDDSDVESSDDSQEYLLDDILKTDHNILKLFKMKQQQESWMEEL